MPDVRLPASEFFRDVALDDLHVIKIHLHLDILGTDFLPDRMRLRLRVQPVSRNVARIDRLDGQGHPLLGRVARGDAQIADKGRAMLRSQAGIGAVG